MGGFYYCDDYYYYHLFIPVDTIILRNYMQIK